MQEIRASALSDAERNGIARDLARIARQAGEVLTCFRSDECRRVLKPDGSPVSEADIASEAEIRQHLSATFPQWSIVSEENAASHDNACGATFFLVDPLDGTRAFLNGGSDFCVLIALVSGGVPLAGAIYCPSTTECWWAGAEAYHSSASDFSTAQRLGAKPVRQGGRIATISSLHAEGANAGMCGKFGITEIRKENSALKFARLAEAGADIYPRMGRTMQWDVAAGDALLRAVGGGVYTLDGVPLRYGARESGWENPDFVAFRRAEDQILLTERGCASPEASSVPHSG